MSSDRVRFSLQHQTRQSVMDRNLHAGCEILATPDFKKFLSGDKIPITCFLCSQKTKQAQLLQCQETTQQSTYENKQRNSSDYYRITNYIINIF